MKLKINSDNEIQIEEVYLPIRLQTENGEYMVISMRDGGFEFYYEGELYSAKKGHVQPFNKSIRGNYLVPQCDTKDSKPNKVSNV